MPAVGGGGNVLKQCFVSDGGDAPVIRISLFETLNLYLLPVDCVVEHLCRFSAKGLKRFRIEHHRYEESMMSSVTMLKSRISIMRSMMYNH